ncbi:hypothetical protein CSC70_02770 [Pseudoxanthomonas kalamensis DSM 18571]|uniref:MgtC/SapB family protein n=1 Tax=Pseudoxanthomonas kalamensis TaxID=289483 RepID=UPI001390BF75|nr:DUF4010 domain-containing protein [Pseudoxanthomonas kalamensis]KAF1712458.1 hypothetical protein CSC70_02770 [Pseudoxanthomonas kalamensis DSM 18571]
MSAAFDAASLLPLTTALGSGLLLGLVYERRKRADPSIIAGLRSHTLAALSGAVSLWLGLPVFVTAFALIGLLVVLGYRRSRNTDPGLTSELALIFGFLLGGLALRQPALTGMLAVASAILVYAKTPLHRLSRELISNREMTDGLILLAFLLIVLPLLPDRTIDPWGLLNPATVWKLVVLVMAIGAIGHIALRLIGNRWGLLVAGFFSGYVSSTAATAGFGRQAREQPELLAPTVGATMLANFSSLSLFVPVLLAVSPQLLQVARWELLAAGATLLLTAVLELRREPVIEQMPPTAEARMFHLGHAIGFAIAITVVIIVSTLLGRWLGAGGALVATLLAAMAELHAAAAGVANLFQTGLLDAAQARWAVVGLLLTSGGAKTLVAFRSGGRAYGLRVGVGLLAMVLAAAATALLV